MEKVKEFFENTSYNRANLANMVYEHDAEIKGIDELIGSGVIINDT